MSDLLKGLFTAVVQSVYYTPVLGRKKKLKNVGFLINSCFGWSEKSEAMRQFYPEFYTGDKN
ncbi:MAG: hypothetical protein ACO2ZM_09400 [Francisellaceae bacterium]